MSKLDDLLSARGIPPANPATPANPASNTPAPDAATSKRDAAPAQPARDPLERRRAFVVRQLEENPELRVAFDVRNATLKAEPGEPVSVLIAVRARRTESEIKEDLWSGNDAGISGRIVSAEFSIPRERFDVVLFARMLEETARSPS